MHKTLFVLVVACSGIVHARGETAPVQAPAVSGSSVSASAPIDAALATPAVSAMRQLILPARAELVLAPDTEISSKTAKLGDKVKLFTTADVLVDGIVVIPKGTPGEGSVSFVKGTGSFGKSGRIEISFNALDLSGRRIALTGAHRQEGSGNGGATAGAVLAAGLVGGFLVSGHSAVIAKNAIMLAYTFEAQSFTMPAPSSNLSAPASTPIVSGK